MGLFFLGGGFASPRDSTQANLLRLLSATPAGFCLAAERSEWLNIIFSTRRRSSAHFCLKRYTTVQISEGLHPVRWEGCTVPRRRHVVTGRKPFMGKSHRMLPCQFFSWLQEKNNWHKVTLSITNCQYYQSPLRGFFFFLTPVKFHSCCCQWQVVSNCLRWLTRHQLKDLRLITYEVMLHREATQLSETPKQCISQRGVHLTSWNRTCQCHQVIFPANVHQFQLFHFWNNLPVRR